MTRFISTARLDHSLAILCTDVTEYAGFLITMTDRDMAAKDLETTLATTISKSGSGKKGKGDKNADFSDRIDQLLTGLKESQGFRRQTVES